ncbi:MAG: CDP-alcohol phosphatidyltransferase family protein [Firmicutes bacterium]|nr:CDP-alcohol phosphatidyltransferase family protein [Bacillota bacterium]
MLSNKNLPNILSYAMIAGPIWLILMKPLTPLFLTIYMITGVTDVLDGAIARKYGTTSEKGAKLDSIADLLFYTLILIRIFPVMWVTLPKKIWIMVGAILLVRFVSYGTAAKKYHRFASLHTYLNKVTGLMVFLVPYAIISPAAIPYCWGVCVVAMIGSIEELILHLTSEEYDPSRKSLLIKREK